MKIKIISITAMTIMLFGCGTIKFTPQEYQLRDGVIPKMSVKGTVQINNVQTATDEAIIYSYGGTKLASDYKTITQVMVEQVRKELKKNGRIEPSSMNKTIDIKVVYLMSFYKIYYESKLRYTATLGNGTLIDKAVNHRSGFLHQDLNGCIADAVVDLLTDTSVLKYLAQ